VGGKGSRRSDLWLGASPLLGKICASPGKKLGQKASVLGWSTCSKIIDDDVEVLWEAEQHGLMYYAIETSKKWCRKGSYPGLPAAVEAILAGQ